jgi:cytochrome c oxidase subunit 2
MTFFSVAPLLLFAADENLNVFDTVSPPAHSIRKIFILVLFISAAIFIFVEGAIVYCIFHFRERSRPTTVEPAQLYGSKPVEVAWTVAPLLVVFILFLVVARIIAEVKISKPPDNALHVVVVGHQWWWEYRYVDPEYNFITANELHVPVDRPIWFELKSADVVHSFWFPRLNGKMDVVPGRTNLTWFLVDKEKPGIYLGQCTEYCGTQHANMILRMEAEAPEVFQEWASNQRRPAVDAPFVREGRQVFLENACMNCHTVRGTPAKGTFGPDLTHLISRETLGSALIAFQQKDAQGNWKPIVNKDGVSVLARWIDDPQKIKPGCWMPDMKLDTRQRDLIVKYLETLK